MVRTKKIAVLTGYGINCNRETALAFDMAIAELDLTGRIETREVHVNQLIRGEAELRDFSSLTIPGGFLHGDDISAGKILAAKLRTHLDDELRCFVAQKKPIMGICNGFQVLVKYPFVPEINGPRKYTLTENRTGRFIDRWVNLKVRDDSCPIFLRGIEEINLPVRHAEGRFYTDDEDLKDMENAGQIALQYVKPDGEPARGEYPANPNGSKRDIGGICDPSGRIFGLMPHPEAFVHPLQQPDWQLKKRRGELGTAGDGLKIFKNVVQYLLEEDLG